METYTITSNEPNK